MNRKTSTILTIGVFCFLLNSCTVFKGVQGVKGNSGKVIGGAPSKEIRTDIQKTQKRQKRQYDREMKKRAKRMGTTKKK